MHRPSALTGAGRPDCWGKIMIRSARTAGRRPATGLAVAGLAVAATLTLALTAVGPAAATMVAADAAPGGVDRPAAGRFLPAVPKRRSTVTPAAVRLAAHRAAIPAAVVPGRPDLVWSDGTRLQQNLSASTFGPLNPTAHPTVSRVAWGPDGSRYAIGLPGAARSHRPDGGNPVTLAIAATATVRDIAYNQSGQRIGLITNPTGGIGRLQVQWSNGRGGAPITVPAPAPNMIDADWTGFRSMVVSAIPSGSTVSRLFTLTLATNDTSGTLAPLVPSDPTASAPGTSVRLVAVNRARTKVAYIQLTATSSSLWVMDPNGANAIRLANGAATFLVGSPVFSVDGTAVYQGATKPAGGTQIRAWPVAGGPSTQVLSNATPLVTGLSVRAPHQPITVVRAAGTDRVGTAIEISQEGWFTTTPGGTCATAFAQAVVLARSDAFADALTAGPLAANKCGPLLTTPPTGLDPRVTTEIQRVLPPGRPIYVVGGTAAISAATVTELQAAGYPVTRLAGTDLFGTAIAVARQIVGTNPRPTFVFANGLNFPDALSAAPGAAVNGQALLLTSNGVLPASVNAYLNSFPAGVFGTAVGSLAAQAVPWAFPIVGADRYATNIAVANVYFYPPYIAGIATGTDYPDALAGGALMGTIGQPLLFGAPTALPGVARIMLDVSSTAVDFSFVFGPTTSLSAAVAGDVSYLSGGQIP